MRYIAVGEVFQIDLLEKKFRCEKAPNLNTCEDCYFRGLSLCGEYECVPGERKDSQSVIFSRVYE